MIVNVKSDCPHIQKDNLIDINKFKQIPFEKLKCKNCDEDKELWICLICGETFCSRYINSHFIEHNKKNPEHCLCVSLMDLSIWCYECIIENKSALSQDKSNEKGCYIESQKAYDYLRILRKFKFNDEENIEEKKKEVIENLSKVNISEEIKKKLMFENKKEICSHIKDEKIIKEFKDYLETFIKSTIKLYNDKPKDKMNENFCGLCLICGDRLDSLLDLDKHVNAQKHILYINFCDLTIICMECKSKYDIGLIDILKYRILFQYLDEKGANLPNNTKLLTTEEIYNIKYQKIIDNFKNNKFSKILFMVGAGISTSAGIPDFRSNTGLFKQLQDKYNLSSPEEFFLLSTFYKNPNYFYEFTKLFDLSKINSTISHKFMNFFVHKNIVKYIFTQNIDGLEIKAKIPNEKLVFAHGNFYEGNCPKCNISIDINKINEAIKKGEIYYCPHCKGPTKPYVVFYGEGLPRRFFEKIQESKDIDLIIIMGTSLKVNPFASLPYLTNNNAFKIVFNMEQVGDFGYNYLEYDSIFIGGKTDENVVKFLKDINMLDEFSEFIKKEYNEDIKTLMNKENNLINVNDKTDNDKVEKLANDIKNLNLNK